MRWEELVVLGYGHWEGLGRTLPAPKLYRQGIQAPCSNLPFGFARIWFALGLGEPFGSLHLRAIIFRPRVLSCVYCFVMGPLVRCCLAPGCSTSLHTWGPPRLHQGPHQFSMRMEPGSLLVLLG